MNRTVSLTLATLLVASTATAAVPDRLHYQGYLTNAVGDPVHCPDAVACPDQDFTLTFRLYDTAEGGDPLWAEIHEAVSVVRGTFDVTLGSVSAVDPALLADPVWLGVEVQGGGEMTPRQRLVSGAFALRAGHTESADAASIADDADRLGGLDAAEYAKLSDLAGLCVTDDELGAVLAQESYLDQGDLEGYLTQSGFVAGAHFSGEFADLGGVPDELLDGDDDMLAMMSCQAGDMARFDGVSWTCDLDRVLTEGEVDQMVANNGYAIAGLLAAVATSGSHDDLADVPPALQQLTLTADGSLAFGDTTIINAAGEWVGSPTGLQGPPGAKGDDGLLAQAGCAQGELLQFDGETWACVAHAADPDAHHSSTSHGLAISPSSVTLDGTATALTDGKIDLGAEAADELTAAMVQTLTAGGDADALHAHASSGGGGGGCYTAWGTTECTAGWSQAYTGHAIYPVAAYLRYDSNKVQTVGGGAGSLVCVKSDGVQLNSYSSSYSYWLISAFTLGSSTSATGLEGETGIRCAMCCN